MNQAAERAPSNLRQAHWGIVSQAANTGSNFLLSVLVARTVTAAEFGAFTVLTVFYMVGLAMARTTGNDVVSILYSGSPQLHTRIREVVTYATGLGVLFGIPCVGVSLLLLDRFDPAYVLMAASLPFHFVQEALRGFAFARGTPRDAAVNDVLRVSVQVAVAALLLFSGAGLTMSGAIVGWALGGVVSALTAAACFSILPARQWPHRWFVTNRHLAAPLGAGEMLAYHLPSNLTFLLMPAVAALSELGVLRAAYLFFGPLGILTIALRSMLLPDAARLDGRRAVHRLIVRATVVLAAVSVVWAALVVALPDAVGMWLLGDSWTGTFVPRLLLGIGGVAEAVMVCGVAALGTFRLADRIVRIQMVMSPLTVLFVVGLAALYGADGAAAGFAVGYVASALVVWMQVPRGRRLDSTSAGAEGEMKEMGTE
jgi:O-antigen/teichoic acid export membrane protein